MTFHYKYSFGVYVNRNMFSAGGDGMPHVFLGLKREKVKCNEGQIQMQKDVYQHYLKHNMPEQANQCKINIEQMQCFKQEATLEDLRKELSEKYKYTFTNDKNFKAWQDVELDKTKTSDKDFDEALRKEFNDNFTSLRQCYADITEPFFIWVKNIKNIDSDYLQTQMSFDKFETLFNEFIESQYSNLDSSLNIKLECKSQESKAILEREQAQRDCYDFLQKSRNDDMSSTAMLHPVLEDNEIKCPHGGVVRLKSNKSKSLDS